MSTLVSAIDLFYIDMGRYPTKDEGLDALLKAPGDDPRWRGPYLRKRQALVDPWGNRFNYRIPGQHGAYDLYSNGSDRPRWRGRCLRSGAAMAACEEPCQADHRSCPHRNLGAKAKYLLSTKAGASWGLNNH